MGNPNEIWLRAKKDLERNPSEGQVEKSVELKLKIVREKWNQTLQKLKFNFLEFLRLFAKISFFFAPT